MQVNFFRASKKYPKKNAVAEFIKTTALSDEEKF